MTAPQGALIARARNIIMQPRSEWPVIDGESTSVQALYMGYIVPLSAIPPIASLIGMSLFGLSLPIVGTLHIPFTTLLTGAITRYVLGLVSVYVLALIVDGLAPTFGGQKNTLQALKVCAYANGSGSSASSGSTVCI
jgi:hypothetical protein